MPGIIYVTQNLINGKIYVGLHTGGQEDYIGSGKLLHRAITKYGLKNFERTILDEFNLLEEGCEKERFWIRELNAKKPLGYNICDGGRGNWGYHHTLDSIKKLHDAQVGRLKTPEHCLHLSIAAEGRPAWNKGKTASLVTKRRMSIAQIGNRNSAGPRSSIMGDRNPMRRPEIVAKSVLLRWAKT